jgi:uncharacterized membrane protein
MAFTNSWVVGIRNAPYILEDMDHVFKQNDIFYSITKQNQKDKEVSLKHYFNHQEIRFQDSRMIIDR